MSTATLSSALPSPLNENPVLDRRRAIHSFLSRYPLTERRLYRIRTEDVFSYPVRRDEIANPRKMRRWFARMTVPMALLAVLALSFKRQPVVSFNLAVQTSTAEKAVYQWSGYRRVAPAFTR